MPVPSLVLVFSSKVGPAIVFHTTPLVVIGEPPSPVTLPPHFALIPVIESTAEVVITGELVVVVVIVSLEYDEELPTELKATTL